MGDEGVVSSFTPSSDRDVSAAAQDRWCGEVTAHEAHGWSESGQEYACDGVPLVDSQASSAGQDGIPDSRCVDCGRVKASDADWRTYDVGEADDLCWGTNCELDYFERRRWLSERFLFWIANRVEIAAYALANKRRAECPTLRLCAACEGDPEAHDLHVCGKETT